MTDADLEARRQIEALQELFRPHLADRVREIEAAWEALQVDGDGTRPAGEPPLRRFYRLAHSLAGTAGSFGYPAVGTAARELERHLHALLPAEGQEYLEVPPSAEILRLLAALARAADAAVRA